jgi:hypothetical protein
VQNLLGVAVGLGLAAACGFRVFLPLLGLSAAAMSGHLTLAPGFAWLATPSALVALGTATVLEVAAYYIPWLDHLLDTIAAPAAMVAGMVATASVASDLPPVVRYGIALIGGGGAAGLIQGATMLLRLKSTAFTGGLANPVVSTLELGGAVLTVLLALVAPILCLVLVFLLCALVFRSAGRLVFGRRGGARTGAAEAP